MIPISLEQAEYWSSLQRISVDMRLRGNKIDMAKLDEGIKVLTPEVDKLKEQINISIYGIYYSLLGLELLQAFDIDSPKQLAKVLLLIGYKLPKTATGLDSSNGKWLKEQKDDKLIALIIEYRSTKKILNDFFLKIKEMQKYTCPDAWCGGKYGRIFPELNILGANATGRTSSSNPNEQNIPKRHEKYGKLIRSIFVPETEGNKLYVMDYCYDDKTEILTNKGWVLFKNLNISIHRVAAVTEGLTITFERPKKIIRLDYDGNMYRQLGDYVDLNVTEGHDLILKGQDSKLNRIPIPKINMPRMYKNLHAGIYETQYDLHFPLIRVAVAVQADAKVCRNKSNQVNGIVFKLKKDRKIKRLKYLLDLHRIPYNEITPPSWARDGFKCIKILQHIGIDTIAVKYWKDLHKLSLRSRLALLEELPFWDGDQKGCYFTSTEENANQIQIAAVLSGIRSTVSTLIPNAGFKPNKPRYVVSLHKNNYSWTCKNTITLSNYVGKVYCVSVSTGKILVRRNGKAVIGSNCSQESRVQVHYAFKIEAKGSAAIRQALLKDPMLDLHKLTYASMFLVEYEEVTKKQKDFVKPINLGLSYGMQSGSLAKAIGKPTKIIITARGYKMEVAGEDAQKVLDLHKEAQPYVHELIEKSKDSIKKKGYIVTLSGRKLYKDKYKDYTAISKLVQGSCACIAYETFRLSYEQGILPLLFIHDEFVVEGLDNARKVEYNMKNAYKLSVPMEVETKEGYNWGETCLIELNSKEPIR